MSLITLDTSKGQLVPFLFGQDAVAATQTDVQLPAVMAEASSAVDGYTIPFPFEVVAICATTSVAGTVGTLAVGATFGGTEDADTTLSFTTGTDNYLRVPRGLASAAAGTRLGCELTTGGTWDGITADLLVTIYCLVYLDGI
jgi:hypothetical protein